MRECQTTHKTRVTTEIINIVTSLVSKMFPQSLEGFEAVGYRVFDGFVHFRVSRIETFRLEDRIPAEVPGTSGLDDRSFGHPAEKPDRRSFRTVVISEGAQSFGGMILESGEHLTKSFRTDFGQEPFDVRTGHSAQRVEA